MPKLQFNYFGWDKFEWGKKPSKTKGVGQIENHEHGGVGDKQPFNRHREVELRATTGCVGSFSKCHKNYFRIARKMRRRLVINFGGSH